MTDTPIWNNRIVGLEYKPANELLANPRNPRRHPASQREALRGSLDTFGWYDVVIENRQTGELLDGHARVEEALSKDDTALIPVLVVDMSPAEQDLALIQHDWITQLADYDRDSLDSLLQDVQTDDTRLQAMLSEMAQEHDLYFGDGFASDELADALYARKVESPVYEPTGKKPLVSDLYDNHRTTQLIDEIDASEDLSNDEKIFLISAAQRHTVFNFSQIANFYAHSSPSVQELMESSSLVIIDYDKAIELGFVKLTHQISELERGGERYE